MYCVWKFTACGVSQDFVIPEDETEPLLGFRSASSTNPDNTDEYPEMETQIDPIQKVAVVLEP